MFNVRQRLEKSVNMRRPSIRGRLQARRASTMDVAGRGRGPGSAAQAAPVFSVPRCPLARPFLAGYLPEDFANASIFKIGRFLKIIWPPPCPSPQSNFHFLKLIRTSISFPLSSKINQNFYFFDKKINKSQPQNEF